MKIDLDEIGDGAVEDAVGDVASGTPEKKRQACGVKGADAASGDEQPGDNCDDDEGAADKEHAQSGRGETGEKTEGDAGIARVNEIEKVLNDRVREAVSGAGLDPGFCGAVEEDDGESEPEEAKAQRKGHEVKELKEVKEVQETAGENILGRRHIYRPISLDFGEGFGAALADLWVSHVLADMS